MLKNQRYVTRLRPREALYGGESRVKSKIETLSFSGRTEAFKYRLVKEDGNLHYLDVISLYPPR